MLRFICFVGASFVALACTATQEAASDRVCAPGLQVDCACPGGLHGAQSCTSDGMAYTKCDCSNGPNGSAGVSGGNWGGEGGGEGGAPSSGGNSSAGGSGNEPGAGGAPSAGGASGASSGGTGGGTSSTGGASSGGSGGTTGGGGWSGTGGFAGGAFGPVGDFAGNIKIQELALYQGVKISLMKNGQGVSQKNAPVVAGRAALVRVFVAPTSGFSNRKLTAKLELVSSDPGVKSQTVNLDVAGASNDANLPSTFNFTIPPEQMKTDVKFAVSIHEPTGGSVGGVDGGVRFPAQGTSNLGAASSGAVRVKFVPFRYNGDGSGRLPDTSNEQMKRYQDILYALYPTSDVQVSLRAPVDYSGWVNAGSGWSEWLDTLCDVRQKDNGDSKVFYFGIMAPAQGWSQYGGGIAGLGFVPDASDDYSRCAVGLGFKDADPNGFIMAHEVGHNHGRPHAPCGVSGEPFPYSNATIGAWGYSFISQKLKEPSGFHDVMSYCDPQWISDVNYSKLFTRIQWVNANYYVAPSAPTRYRKLLVETDGTVQWGRSVDLGRSPGGQKRRVELLDDSGRSLSEVDGFWVPTSEDPGGTLFLPEPPEGTAAIRADGLPDVSLETGG